MENNTNCPICLEEFENREELKASTDACDHVFCLECLKKWARIGSYCPVDRKRFKKIINLKSDDVIRVKSRKRRRKSRPLFNFTYKCENCDDNENPGVLLLCDSCDLAYHTFCLIPPLNVVPSGMWICPICASVEKKMREQSGIKDPKEEEIDAAGSHIPLHTVKEHIESSCKVSPTQLTAVKNQSDSSCTNKCRSSSHMSNYANANSSMLQVEIRSQTPRKSAKDQNEFNNSCKGMPKINCHVSDDTDARHKVLQDCPGNISKVEKVSISTKFREHSQPPKSGSVRNKLKRTKILKQSCLVFESSDYKRTDSADICTHKNSVFDVNDSQLTDSRSIQCLKDTYKFHIRDTVEHNIVEEICSTELHSNFIPPLHESFFETTSKKTLKNDIVMHSHSSRNNVIESLFKCDQNSKKSQQQMIKQSLKNVKSTSLCPKRSIFRRNSSSVGIDRHENIISKNCDLSDCCLIDSLKSLSGDTHISQHLKSSATSNPKSNITEPWLNSFYEDTRAKHSSVFWKPNDRMELLHEGNKNSLETSQKMIKKKFESSKSRRKEIAVASESHKNGSSNIAIPGSSSKKTFKKFNPEISSKNTRKLIAEEKAEFSIFQKNEGMDASIRVYSKLCPAVDNSGKAPVRLGICTEKAVFQERFKRCRRQFMKLKPGNIKLETQSTLLPKTQLQALDKRKHLFKKSLKKLYKSYSRSR